MLQDVKDQIESPSYFLGNHMRCKVNPNDEWALGSMGEEPRKQTYLGAHRNARLNADTVRVGLQMSAVTRTVILLVRFLDSVPQYTWCRNGFVTKSVILTIVEIEPRRNYHLNDISFTVRIRRRALPSWFRTLWNITSASIMPAASSSELIFNSSMQCSWQSSKSQFSKWNWARQRRVGP